MCDFLRVIAWFCDEKFSLKKSCFYLYIRRRYVHCGTTPSHVETHGRTYMNRGIKRDLQLSRESPVCGRSADEAISRTSKRL